MTPRIETLRDLRRWCSEAPAGTRVDASELAELLDQVEGGEAPERPASEPAERAETTWRERLWTAPAECRIGVEELSEALGRSPSWIYQRTQQDADPRLPHGKLSGSLVFRCGEVRAWLRDTEEDVVAYRMESAPGELRVQAGGAR